MEPTPGPDAAPSSTDVGHELDALPAGNAYCPPVRLSKLHRQGKINVGTQVRLNKRHKHMKLTCLPFPAFLQVQTNSRGVVVHVAFPYPKLPARLHSGFQLDTVVPVRERNDAEVEGHPSGATAVDLVVVEHLYGD